MTEWIRALPGATALAENEVHLWRIDLRRAPSVLAALSALLSAEERERARVQAHDDLRRRYTVAHGEMRRILAGYAGAPPERLAFSPGSEKPRLLGDGPRFNLAHSADLALLAVAAGREVGIDVEGLGLRRDTDAVLRSFAPEEEVALASLPPEPRRLAVLGAWTRKEAVLKAMGRGLTEGPGSVRVTVLPGEPARLLSVRNRPGEAARWALADLDCGAGHVAALAAEGKDWVPRYWEASDD
jgi:4'-phosphopantetheinyl transferase